MPGPSSSTDGFHDKRRTGGRVSGCKDPTEGRLPRHPVVEGVADAEIGDDVRVVLVVHLVARPDPADRPFAGLRVDHQLQAQGPHAGAQPLVEPPIVTAALLDAVRDVEVAVTTVASEC